MSERRRSIGETFAFTCRKFSSDKAITFFHKHDYTWLTYNQLYQKVMVLSEKLKSLGITPRTKVTIVLENSEQWPIVFFSLICCRAVIIPLNYQDNENKLSRIIKHAQPQWVITSSCLYETLKIWKNLPCHIYLINKGYHIKSDKVKKEDTNLPRDTAVILYTSGTTGTPKGVILTHKNLLANVSSLQSLNILQDTDCILAPLPFYHSYPLMVTILLPLLSGARISIPPTLSGEAIFECIRKTEVTIIVGVPRFFEVFVRKIEETINSMALPIKFILSLGIGITSFLRRYTGLNITRYLLPSLHKKFPPTFRFMISGGARLDPGIARKLFSYGFTILEGYGLTEASPVVSFNRPGEFKFGSAGKPLPDVEIKIIPLEEDGEGEILVKGNNVSPGYYLNQEDTSSTFKNGYLHTNDIGYIDRDGFLFITGRKNEIIVLPSGKNINPEEIERHYLMSPFIKEICVLKPKGSSSLAALIYPDYDYFSMKRIIQIKERLRWEIEKLSQMLPSYERIKEYKITSSPLPATVLGKIKREEAEKIYESMENVAHKKITFTDEDKLLLSHPLCKKGYEFLKKKLNREVNLDDHLELDLGLDSLEQIGLLLEFKNITGASIDEFQLIGISTVRDIMKKLQETSPLGKKEEPTDWSEVLKTPPSEEFTKLIENDLSLSQKTIALLLYLLSKILAKTFFHLSVKGKLNFPKKGPFIITPNHTSFLDAPVVIASLPWHIFLNTFFLGYRIYLENPLLRWAKKILRLIPIDPASTIIESMTACAFILRKGKNLCLFPEGTRSIDGEVKNFQRGTGILMKELNVPAVPTYIKGTNNAWHPSRPFPKPAKVQITFGPPVWPDKLLASTKENIDIYQYLVDNLREEVLHLSRASENKL